MPHPPLTHDEVHAWWARLDAPDWRVGQLAQTLAPDELDRAARFHARRDRERWIVARGLLRERLGAYSGCSPKSVRLEYGPFGKPALVNSSVRFSVSHSDNLAVFALAHEREIGVDVEAIRPSFDLDRLAEDFFSPIERAALRRLRSTQRVAGFFNCWTRKEAFVKATGMGLSQPLDEFDVELVPGRPPRVIAIRADPYAAQHWTLAALDPLPGFAAAVALPSHIRGIRQLWIDDE
jgi:4'-phosphopantetheinyl transferase